MLQKVYLMNSKSIETSSVFPSFLTPSRKISPFPLYYQPTYLLQIIFLYSSKSLSFYKFFILGKAISKESSIASFLNFAICELRYANIAFAIVKKSFWKRESSYMFISISFEKGGSSSKASVSSIFLFLNLW